MKMATPDVPLDGSPVVLRGNAGRKMSRHLSFRDSVMSIKIDRTEIDAILGKKWHFREVQQLMVSQLATMPGGRDRQGGAVVVMVAQDEKEFSPHEVGKVMTYLSNIPEPATRQCGFTIVIDARKSTWHVAKTAIKSLHHTFSEHITQLLLLKPNKFWERRRAGMGNRSRYTFAIHMLDNCKDLLHYLGASQLPVELEGSLPYNHDDWIAAQEVLEKTEAELLALLTEYEQLQEIMEHYNLPGNLSTAKDALQLHTEHAKLIEEQRLAQLVKRCQDVIKRLRQPALHPYAFSPSKHPDFKACMLRLESHMGQLYSTCGLLTTLWRRKDEDLQACLQLRQLEWEHGSHLKWLEEEGKWFLRKQMDIGNSYETAIEYLHQWKEFSGKVNLVGQQICATLVVGEELQSATHYASEHIKGLMAELSNQWENFCQLLQERVGLLELSVNFHEKLQLKFLRKLKSWLDECKAVELSDSVEDSEELIDGHDSLKETYQLAYSIAMNDGQQLREGLMHNMSTTTGGTPTHSSLSAHLQRVQGMIDSTTDQLHHLNKEWTRRSHELHCQLNLCRFRKESEQVLLWISQQGNKFLVETNSIGSNAEEANQILMQFDKFEEGAAEIYNTCTQLLSWAQQMEESGTCWPDQINQEAIRLEGAVQEFVSRLEQCRETMVVAIDYHNKTKKTHQGWEGLQQRLLGEQYEDGVDGSREQLHQLKLRWNSDCQGATQMFSKASELTDRLNMDVGVDYQLAYQQVENVVRSLQEEQQKAQRVWKWRQSCLEAWLSMHQYAADVAMHLDRSSSWLEQVVSTNMDAIQSLVDAQMKLDSFSRQTKEIQAAHDKLVTSSQEVLAKLEQFGLLTTAVYGHTSTQDHVTQLVQELGALLVEVKSHGEIMEKQLKDCLEFYHFRQQVEECSISIGQCASSIEPVYAVGHSMSTAERLNDLTLRSSEQMKAVNEALDVYEGQLKEFVAKQHFRHDQMQSAFTAAKTKWVETNDRMNIKLRLLNLTIVFYGNAKTVDSKLDNAQRVFGSKDAPSTIEACDHLLAENGQLLEEVKQTCKELEKEGQSLCNQLLPWLKTGTQKATMMEDVAAYCTPPLRRDGKIRNSIDHLDVAGGKELTSYDHTNQALMRNRLREAHCKELFSNQQQYVRQIAMRIKYENEVHEAIQWVNDIGNKHVDMDVRSNDEQEAQQLLLDHREFMENEATIKNVAVNRIRETAKSFIDNNHIHSAQVKLLLGELNAVWGRFERNLKTREYELVLLQEFQEKMSSCNNWCSGTKELLNSFQVKMSMSDTSQEIYDMVAELKIYTTTTKLEHNTRVIRTKALASQLKLNELNDLVCQMEGETSSYIQQLGDMKTQLREHAEKLVLVEQEQDKRQRILKQQERVLEELVSTERLYVADLMVAMDRYLLHYNNIPMVDAVEKKEGIVFGNLESIGRYHSNTFLPQLEKAQGWDEVTELFLKQSEQLAALYVSFCQGKTASEQLIVANISFFNKLQNYVEVEAPLSSYLIKPVQRITKYPLLLKEALRYRVQVEDENNCTRLQLACQQLEKVVTRTNNAVHLSMLDGFEEPLIELGILLYQGSLVITERGWRSHEKERHVFLFQLGILLCRRQELSLGRIKYVFKQKIMAGDILSVELLEDPCKFLLVLKGDQKLVFKSLTVEEREKWTGLLTAVLNNLDLIKESDALQRASARGSLRRNAVTITRSSSMSPTSVIVNNADSPRSSPTQFLDSPSMSRTDSISSRNSINVLRGSPVLSRRSPTPSRNSPTPSRNSPSPEHNNTFTFSVLHRTASSVSASSRTNSHTSNDSPTSLHRTMSAVQPRATNYDTTDQGNGKSQKYMVLKDFDPPKGGRGIKLKRNQSVFILHKGEEEWFARTSSGQVGWVPKEIVDSTEPQDSSPKSGSSRRHGAIRRRGGGIKPAVSNNSIASMEDDEDKLAAGKEKMMFVLKELLDTEKEYVEKMNDLIKGFIPEMSSSDLPEALLYKERIVFGNIEDLHTFHNNVFFPALSSHDLQSDDIHETIATCFINNANEFEMYVKYCENKPRSEALLAAAAGAYFDGIQLQLGQKEDISSLLIRPVQRITKYQLLLGQMLKTAEKYVLPYTELEKAVKLMTEIPKRANDKMKLGSIDGYPGNINTNGALLMCDDFTVYEKTRWNGTSRRVFLMDAKMIITKVTDDGRCVYKDGLNLHNLTLTESLSDSCCKFAVNSAGTSNSDHYYIIEAHSAELKEEWVESIKKILLKDMEMLKALVGGAPSTITAAQPQQIAIWSDSDDEGQYYSPPQKLQVVNGKEAPQSKDELYIVTEDCAPSTEGEGILYMKCGQVYEVISKVSDWWKGRLVVDMANPDVVGQEGWVAPSFLNRYTGNLQEQLKQQQERLQEQQRSQEQLRVQEQQRLNQSSPQFRHRSVSDASVFGNRDRAHSKGYKKLLRRGKQPLVAKAKENPFASPTLGRNKMFSEELSDVSCMVGETAKFRCSLAAEWSNIKANWLHNGNPIRHSRAFMSEGQTCIFQIKPVEFSDAGNYSCHLTVGGGTTVISSARLKVITSPNAPGQPTVVQSAPSLVSLYWEKPIEDGGGAINGYVVTGSDQDERNPSNITEWFPKCGGIVRELSVGHTYIFTVKAINKAGESIPSNASQPVTIPFGSVKKFTMQREYSTGVTIGGGRFSEVHLLLQGGGKLACKLIKNNLGEAVAQRELEMLMMVSHKNIVVLEDSYKTSKHFGIVMNLVDGCSLFGYVVQQDCLTEELAVDCLHQLLSALQYLHTHHIAHLDIKAENVMATSSGVVPHVTLIDFGSAQFIPPGIDVMVDIPAGNIDFVAPEILNNKSVSTATDMWAFGVFTYILLSGIGPFIDSSKMAAMKDISTAKYSFSSKQFHPISSTAKSFISRLLVLDGKSRLTSSEALEAPWIQGEIKKSSKSQIKLDVNGLKQFNAKRMWQGSKSSYKERRSSKT